MISVSVIFFFAVESCLKTLFLVYLHLYFDGKTPAGLRQTKLDINRYFAELKQLLSSALKLSSFLRRDCLRMPQISSLQASNTVSRSISTSDATPVTKKERR